MRHARKCYNCGKVYSYCPDCSDDRSKPAIMSTFHNQNCADIFDICVKFNMGLLSKEEAKDMLSCCDLKEKSSFRKDVQRDIKTIFAENKKRTEVIESAEPQIKEEIKE